MNKLSLIALTLSLVATSSFTLAETMSQQSQSYESGATNIIVGKTQSTMGPHGGSIGDPGIGSRSMKNGMTISFSGLKNMVTNKPDNVYVLESSGGPHGGGMGKFQFSQVADAEVYYGDWSQTGVAGDTVHTAYFSGKDGSTEVPTSGQATYTIEGVNQFDGEAKLTGKFNADFGTKDYTGTLVGESLNIAFNGDIHNGGTFSGDALANDSIKGVNSGQFFGDNAEQLAGITTFEDNNSLDTAFGGRKD